MSELIAAVVFATRAFPGGPDEPLSLLLSEADESQAAHALCILAATGMTTTSVLAAGLFLGDTSITAILTLAVWHLLAGAAGVAYTHYLGFQAVVFHFSLAAGLLYSLSVLPAKKKSA